ncbi:MAG: PqqD family protein [Acidobacteriota bacterium]|nr:PqqD family protein [Acidobacteriota bacterium]
MPTRLVPSPDALARELNGEILLLDLRTSHYFGLTGTGARIWELVEAGESRDAIGEILTREFDADAAQIEEEVARFLDDLVERGLLVAAPA